MKKNVYENKGFAGKEAIKEVPQATITKHPYLVSGYKLPESLASLITNQNRENVALSLLADEQGNAHILTTPVKDASQPVEKMDSTTGVRVRKNGKVNEMVELLAHTIDKASGNNYNPKSPVPGYNLLIYGNQQSDQFLKMLLEYNGATEKQVKNACQRKAKSFVGKYDRKTKKWTTEPLVKCNVELKMRRKTKTVEIGILMTVQNSIKFYILTPSMTRPITVWAHDVNNFYLKPLKTSVNKALRKDVKEYVPMTKNEKYGTFYSFKDYYKSYNDKKNIEEQSETVKNYVRQSVVNGKAIIELMNRLRSMTKKAFGNDIKDYLSTGSLAKLAFLTYMDEEENKSISIFEVMENWGSKGVLAEDITQTINIAVEAFSAGQIELIRGGYVKRVGMVDITNAYPAIMSYGLLDLRNATIKTGKNCSFDEVPKVNGTNIVFIFADTEIPRNSLHTLTVKSDSYQGLGNTIYEYENKYTVNLRPHGRLNTTGLYEQYEDLLLNEDESKVNKVHEWVEIQTEGKISPLSKVSLELFQKRMEARNAGREEESVLKTTASSLYGKLLECIRTYEEEVDEEGISETTFTGFTAGAWFNPIYGAIICAFVRIKLVEMAREIEKNGGLITVLMTDAIYFEMPDNRKIIEYVPQQITSVLSHYKGLEITGWTQEKVLGMYHTPQEYEHGMFLQSGVYEYYDKNKVIVVNGEKITGAWEHKIMGILADELDKTQPFLTRLIMESVKAKRDFVEFSAPVLIASGNIAQGSFDYTLLGSKFVKKEQRFFNDLKGKRVYRKLDYSLKNLLTGLIDTTSVDYTNNGRGKELYTSRLNECRRDYKVILTEGKAKKAVLTTDKPQREKKPLKQDQMADILGRQIQKSLREKLPEGEKMIFGLKRGSYDGNNARDIAAKKGMEALRLLVRLEGLTPEV